MAGNGTDGTTVCQTLAASGDLCSISCHQSLFCHPVPLVKLFLGQLHLSVAMPVTLFMNGCSGLWEAGSPARAVALRTRGSLMRQADSHKLHLAAQLLLRFG